MVSFNHALQGIKSDLSTLLPAELIESLCDQLRLVGRRRVLTPTVTTYLALDRALHAAPMSALRHLSGFDVSAQAFCQGIRRLPVRIRTPGRRVQRLTLVTTLVDVVAFPAQMIADMFAVRWQAETNIGYLKQTLQLDVLRSQSVDGVLKELHCITIIYNLVRRVMLEAARRQRVEPRRVSFIDALRWLRQARPEDELTDLIINPHRPNRFQPRVKKRRPKSYPLMTRPRHELKKSLASQAKQRLT